MYNLQYKIHLILQSKYKVYIYVFLVCSVYLVFYTNQIAYCMYEGKLYSYKFPEEWFNDPNPDIRAYAHYLAEDRRHCYAIAEMEYFQIEEEYKRHLEYTRRQAGITTPLEINARGILLTDQRDEILNGYYRRNGIPFAGLDYNRLKVDIDYYADKAGKIVREVSTIDRPFDVCSHKYKYKDIFYPAYHPGNGCKPYSEDVRILVKTEGALCTIS